MSKHLLSYRQIAWLLASIAAIMPFAIDAYLPAVPAIAHSLNTNSADIQQNLSSFLIGQAFGLIIGGTISDIKGRKPIVLIGLGVFALSSLLLIFINTIEQLLILRFIQAIGAGMIAAMGGAIVRDYYDGQQAAQMFALIGLIMMMAPLLAPTIGSILHYLLGWRAIFAFLAFYAISILFIQIKFLPQKNIIAPQQSWSGIVNSIMTRYIRVFSTRTALGFLFMQSFSFAAMFCFLTESPFVYMQYFQLNEFNYAVAFACNLITMMVFNRITAWRLKQGTAPHKILAYGVTLQCILNISLFVTVFINSTPPLWLFISLVCLSIGTQGFVSANTQACFMQSFQAEGGSANGVLLSAQALIAAGVGYLTTQLHNHSLMIMPMMMMFCSLFGASLLWIFSRHIWSKQNTVSLR